MNYKMSISRYILCSIIFATLSVVSGEEGTVSAPLVADVDNLFLTSDALSRSISQENITGEKGGGSRTEIADGSAGDRS